MAFLRRVREPTAGRPGGQAGRRAEFEALARGLERGIYNSALRLTRNAEDAADLAQEALVKAYSCFHQFEPGTNFRAWFYRILTNTYINEYRRRQRLPEMIGLEEEAVERAMGPEREQPRGSEPEREVLDEVPDEEVQAALDALPDVFRTVVVLCDLQQFSYEEIASMVGVPIGTVRSRLFRARRLLRESLHEYARARRVIP